MQRKRRVMIGTVFKGTTMFFQQQSMFISFFFSVLYVQFFHYCSPIIPLLVIYVCNNRNDSNGLMSTDNKMIEVFSVIMSTMTYFLMLVKLLFCNLLSLVDRCMIKNRMIYDTYPIMVIHIYILHLSKTQSSTDL